VSTINIEIPPGAWTLVVNAGLEFALEILSPTQVHAELAAMDTAAAPAASLRGLAAHERRSTRLDAGAGYVFIRTDRAALLALNTWS